MGVWGLRSQPPEAIGGLGAPLPAAGGTGVWGPQRLKILHFFQKYLNFRAILIKNNAFKTWHRNW